MRVKGGENRACDAPSRLLIPSLALIIAFSCDLPDPFHVSLSSGLPLPARRSEGETKKQRPASSTGGKHATSVSAAEAHSSLLKMKLSSVAACFGFCIPAKTVRYR